MDAASLDKVARTARWNGGSIVVVAGLAALFAALDADVGTALFGAAIAAAGAIEHRSGAALARGADRTWEPAYGRQVRGRLIGAELVVLVMIVGYSVWRLATVDVAGEIAALPDELREALVGLVGGDEALLAETFRLALDVTYTTLILVTLAYQGGMAWWYARRLAPAAP